MANVNIDYPGFLQKCWQAALEPRTRGATRVMSLFAGGGGSVTGYAMAGCRDVAAVEWSSAACDTLRENWPGLRVYEGDICEMDPVSIMDELGLEPGELDILDGSPPCQGFSTAGRREMSDSRNQLFREYVRFLAAFQPKAFVMENVSGLIKGKMRLIFRAIHEELSAVGYRVTASLLDASAYGVPQRRKRTLFLGLKSGVPTMPSPIIRRPVVVGSALVGASTAGVRVGMLTDRYGQLWSKIPMPIGRRLSTSAAVVLNGVGFQCCLKPNPAMPSPTLSAQQGQSGYGTFVHWAEARPLSIGEAKRLQSFPDNYKLTGTYQEQWRRIGNSVPPLMMRAIALHVKSLLAQNSKSP